VTAAHTGQGDIWKSCINKYCSCDNKSNVEQRDGTNYYYVEATAATWPVQLLSMRTTIWKSYCPAFSLKFPRCSQNEPGDIGIDLRNVCRALSNQKIPQASTAILTVVPIDSVANASVIAIAVVQIRSSAPFSSF
jgi:hypothetical protein